MEKANMNLDFDTFEFAGLIAPGTVVLVAIVFLERQVVVGVPSIGVVALGLVAAYILGHLVAALASMANPLFGRIAPRVEALTISQWLDRGYIGDDQVSNIKYVIETRLVRPGALDGPDERDVSVRQRRTVVKQMYLSVARLSPENRLDMFNGLCNLARCLSVSFLIAGSLALISRQYVATGICVAASLLSMYRLRKFNDSYSRELLQQFLLPQKESRGKCDGIRRQQTRLPSGV
jgi:hypothetical protein